VRIKEILTQNRIIDYSLCLFGAFPLLPESLKGLPVVLLFFIALYTFFQEKNKAFNYKRFITFSSLYLVSLLSIIYSGSFHFPKNKTETALALIIVPLSFSFLATHNIELKIKKRILKLFIVSTSLLSIICLYYYYINGLFNKELFKVNSFRKLITEIPIINDHPIYVSFFIGISILFAITCFKNNSKLEKAILIFLCIINVSHLLLLSSKGAIIAVIIAAIVLFFSTIKSRINRILLPTLILGIFIISIIYFPNMERRFREFSIKSTYTELHTTNSSSIRIAIYKCALEKIKENPILGYGWGQGEKELRVCYKEKSDYLYFKKFNSHNQFLGYYLDGGVIAFTVLLLFLFWQFRHAIINKKYLFFASMIFFSILMLSENILNRQSGIIVFIFFVLLFRNTPPKKNNTLIN
jgi:O-antigen ligase